MTSNLWAGLWRENPALVQLLGLCPLLAVSGTVRTAMGLGLTTLAVLTLASFGVSLLRRLLDDDTRLPAQILVIASLVTAADMTLEAFAFDLHQRIGLFVALIVTNCALLGRAEAFARRHGTVPAVIDGASHGLGFLAAIAAMGAVREALGQGTLFAGMGPVPTVDLPGSGILIFALPPGAFLTLAGIVVLKNLVDDAAGRGSGQAADDTPPPPHVIARDTDSAGRDRSPTS
ncbi:MAG: electron transport complex subunit RsxE [Gammaproteobacteria bacterium]|nr:electron transport complex subunit RsxE [Gammaproteobacteria bacterium]